MNLILSWAEKFMLRDLFIVLWQFHYMKLLSFLAVKMLSLVLTLTIICSLSWCLSVALFGLNLFRIFGLPGSGCLSPQVWEVFFSYYCFKYAFHPFSFSSSGIPIVWILLLFIMSYNSCRLSLSLFTFYFLLSWLGNFQCLLLQITDSSARLSLLLKLYLIINNSFQFSYYIFQM